MKIKTIITTLLLAAATAAQADAPTVHGMFLFGDKVTYVSHLPMFHSPHDYQLIMKVELADLANSKAMIAYEALKIEEPAFFTISPEVMDLTEVMTGLKTQFTAKLYHGHFERGGKNLGSVVVHVQKIVLSSKLNPKTEEQNQYFVFGEGNEYFGAHLIQGKPSYDTIVKLKKPYTLKFTHCRTRVCDNPLEIPINDDQLPLTLPKVILDRNIDPKNGDQIGSFNGVLSDILNVLYFEQDELSH